RDRENEQLRHRLDQLLRRLYGPRSEAVVGPTPFDGVAPPPAASSTAEPPAPPASAPTVKRSHGRPPFPQHPPPRPIQHDLNGWDKFCPCCGATRVKIGEEVSEQLDYVPASLFVVEHVRAKYVCRQCQGQLAVAPVPSEPIAKGIPGAGLVASVIVDKFV